MRILVKEFIDPVSDAVFELHIGGLIEEYSLDDFGGVVP